MRYCARDTKATFEVFKQVYVLFLERFVLQLLTIQLIE